MVEARQHSDETHSVASRNNQNNNNAIIINDTSQDSANIVDLKHYFNDISLNSTLIEPTNESISSNSDYFSDSFTEDEKAYIGTLATEPPPYNYSSDDSVSSVDSELYNLLSNNNVILSDYEDISDVELQGWTNAYNEINKTQNMLNWIDETIYNNQRNSNRNIPHFDGIETEYYEEIPSDNSDDYDGSESYSNGEFENDSIDDTNGEYDYDSSLGELAMPDEIICNNINYIIQNVGFGKEYISGASAYPPEYDYDVGGPCSILDVTNCNDDLLWEEIESNVNVDINHIISDTRGIIRRNEDETVNICDIYATPIATDSRIIGDEYYSINNINKKDYEVIPRDVAKWMIKIPVQIPGTDEIKIVEMMADTGANVGCINYDFALKYWGQTGCIFKVGRKDVFSTPGGPVSPKLCCHFIIPTKSGKNLKAILYLIKGLSVDMIADLNMLRKLGYKMEAPKNNNLVYSHKEEVDLDLQLDLHPQIHTPMRLEDVKYQPNHIDTFEKYVNIKYNHSQYIEDNHGIHAVYTNREINTCNSITGGNKLLYDEHLGSLINEDNELLHCDIDTRVDHIVNNIISNQGINCDNIMSDDSILAAITTNKYYEPGLSDEILDHVLDDPSGRQYHGSMEQIEGLIDTINSDNKINQQLVANVHTTHQPLRIKPKRHKLSARMFGTRDYGLQSRTLNTRWGNLSNNITMNGHRYINFIMMKQSFLATDEEYKTAMALNANKPLKMNDVSYLKNYPELYGPKFTNFYDKTKKLLTKYDDVFAKSTYDRRTMFIPGVRLGIMEKYRKTACYKSQYPLSIEQRKWMIYYTELNVLSGYWYPVTTAIHCIPFTMVSKKDAQGNITRMRPALDCRLVNTMCEDMRVTMPTLRDFDEIYAIKGLFTLADIKNMYDCIPLDKRDRPWATVMTPLGLFQMRCLGYGWKNAPAIAQGIMNNMALQIMYMLVYIDDILLKHPEDWDGDQHLDHLESFLSYCRVHNILLSPTKFYPFVSECTSFGFKRTMDGSTVSDDYKKKVVAFNQPTDTRQLKEYLGMIGYIKRYLYNGSIIDYWLNRLVVNLPPRGHIDWEKYPEAQLAWLQLGWLTRNAPLLYNPNINGTFCIKCDACNYGAGAVLYQQQKDKDGKLVWRMIDMMNKTMPRGLRHAHSMVHEAWAIVQACQYWQFHLLRRPFIISTDNQPISKLFTNEYRDLNDQTQRQLLRLRVAITMFTYEMRHVPGVKNELPDGLSRYTAQIIKENKIINAKCARALENSDTNHRELSSQERAELDYYSNRSTRKYQELTQSTEKDLDWQIKFIQKSNYINSFNNIFMIYEILNRKPRINEYNYNSIRKQLNKTWNKTMKFYSRSARYNEKARINSILNSSKDNVLTSNEYSFNDKPFYELYKQLPNIKNTMNKINNKILEDITFDTQNELLKINMENRQKELKYYYKQQNKKYYTKNTKCYTMNTIHNHCQHHTMPVQQSEYYQRDEFDSDSGDSEDPFIPNIPKSKKQKQYTPSTIITRSKSKKMKQELQKKQANKQKKSKMKNTRVKRPKTNTKPKVNKANKVHDSAREDEYYNPVKKVDYVDPKFEDITKQLHCRNEFMTMLYGYRHKTNIFNPKTLCTYQDADVPIQCVKYLLTVYEETQILNERDDKDVRQAMSDLRREDPDMYKQLMDGHYYINDEYGLLAIDATDELTNETRECWVVPDVLKGKFMDYAHHNPQSHHYHWKQTYYNLSYSYHWTGMLNDVQDWCSRCLLCHYVKGSVRHRSPMQIRQISKPREHLMIDFIGSIFGKYYILAIIDYCTGWTMLIPCVQSNTQTVIEALLDRWIPIHGNFKYLDSDYGSYFNSKLFRAFCKANQTDIQFTEPRSHRGIGKVERVIQLVQMVLQRFNIALGESLTDTTIQESKKSWNMIKCMLPHIQTAINQRRPRFTTFSPNMLMFGTNVKDLSNMHQTSQRLKRIFEKQDELQINEHNKDINNKSNQIEFNTDNLDIIEKYDYRYLERLMTQIQHIYDLFKHDWEKYTYLSKVQYDHRYNITRQRIKDTNKKFTEGTKVLYYIGDTQQANKKWRSKWTGPWIISKVLNDSTVIIEDKETGNQKRVSKDRIKIFKLSEIEKYKEIIDDEEYITHYDNMKDMLQDLGSKPQTESQDKQLIFDQIRPTL